MRRALEIVVLIGGVVCVVIGLAHIAMGPEALPGAESVNATMDSMDRFYATIFLGYGVALAWCSRDLASRSNVFAALLALLFVGGLARLVSMVVVGRPNDFTLFLLAIELVAPPLLWFWHRRSVSREAPEVAR